MRELHQPNVNKLVHILHFSLLRIVIIVYISKVTYSVSLKPFEKTNRLFIFFLERNVDIVESFLLNFNPEINLNGGLWAGGTETMFVSCCCLFVVSFIHVGYFGVSSASPNA